MDKEFKTYFDDSFANNRKLWETDPEKSHENQVKLVDELDARTGKKSRYDEASGIWYLSDGRRSDEIGMGLLGNSTLSPVFDYKETDGYKDYKDASEHYKNAEFIYNPQNDESYKRYKSYYEQNGKKAMEDTLGKLSSATGGVAGSYAVSAAAGAYNDYMEDISGKMTEFEDRAYERFKDEKDSYLNLMKIAEDEITREEELWKNESDYINEENTGGDKSADYALMKHDFIEKGWDGLSYDQKILALSYGWYDSSTGILYDEAGNAYTSTYDPVKNALATYKTKGIKGLTEKDVMFLENAGYKIQNGILYTAEWQVV